MSLRFELHRTGARWVCYLVCVCRRLVCARVPTCNGRLRCACVIPVSVSGRAGFLVGIVKSRRCSPQQYTEARTRACKKVFSSLPVSAGRYGHWRPLGMSDFAPHGEERRTALHAPACVMLMTKQSGVGLAGICGVVPACRKPWTTV